MNKNHKLNKILENQTDMPPVSLSNLSYIEISGDNHIELDGIVKILECNENLIRIRFKHKTVLFKGENLQIRNYFNKSAIINGKITSIIFE